MKENKRNLLENRLRKRLRVLELKSYAAYWHMLNSPISRRKEMKHFLNEITTNESYFQRSINHFEILTKHILPQYQKQHKTDIRIWSAGCSTGEEPHDLAMILHEFNSKNSNYFDFKIFATDISLEVLDFAKQGEYADRKIAKIPTYLRKKYFTEVSKENTVLEFAKDIIQVKPQLQEKIEFTQLNLLSSHFFSNIDLLFCRNVMIYFDIATQKKVVNRFAQSLSSDGYLFVGHSETLRITETNLDSVRFENGTIYKAKNSKNEY